MKKYHLTTAAVAALALHFSSGAVRAAEVAVQMRFTAEDFLPGRFDDEHDPEQVRQQGFLETPVSKRVSYGDGGGVVIDELPPGRYRAVFTIGASPEHDLPMNLSCRVSVGRSDFHTRVTATEFPPDGFIEREVDFYVPPDGSRRVELRTRWSGHHRRPSALRTREIVVEQLASPLYLTRVQPDKILYRIGESGHAKVSVANSADEQASVTLVLHVEHGLAERVKLTHRHELLQPGVVAELAVPFDALPGQFGNRLVIRLLHNDAVVDSRCDVAGVSDNVWDVSLGAPSGGILHNSGAYSDAAVDGLVRRCRNEYSNWIEKHFWAPDCWGNLTPEADEWMSGQAYRYENKQRLKLLIRRCQEQGIRAITYGKGMAGGPSGLDLARRRPHWFVTGATGIPVGRDSDAWDVDHWDDVEFHRANRDKFRSAWFYRVPDLRQIDVLDHGIDELIESSRRFGWDGVRFDGHFSAGNDAMSTRNMQRMKRRLLEEFPDYVFGYNLQGPEQFLDGVPHEIREAAAGGAHWMNEAIGQWLYSGGRLYRSWRRFAEQENANGQRVRDLGATYQWIYGLHRAGAVESMYKFIIGTAVGAHPVYGAHTRSAGTGNWGRFLTRWSMLVWHPHLRNITSDEAVVHVGGADVWDFLSKQAVLDSNRRIEVIHLINPPPDDDINADVSPTIEPVTGLVASYRGRADERLAGLYLVMPGSVEARRLSLDADGDAELPAVASWATVVADLRGEYDVPPPRPRFTEPPDPDEVAAAMHAVDRISDVDPLRPEEQQHVATERSLRNNPAFNSWSVRHSPVSDPEARNGRAASFDADLGHGVIGSFFSDLPIGTYRATARIKALNPSPQTSIMLHAYSSARVHHPRVILRAVDFADGYREATIEVRHMVPRELFRVFVAGRVTDEDEVVMCDSISLELLEAYSDHDIADYMDDVEPLRHIGPPERVLVLYGHYHQFLRLPEVIEALHPGAEATYHAWRDRPEGADDIAEYGTIIMANLQAVSYPARATIRDFVSLGGHFIVFGGQFTLSQGGWNRSFLSDILPVELVDAPDVIGLSEPTPLRPAGSQPWQEKPLLFYLHRVTPKPDARILWQAGDLPVLTTHRVGKGRVTLFSGCVLGEAEPPAIGFWDWHDWDTQLADALRQ